MGAIYRWWCRRWMKCDMFLPYEDKIEWTFLDSEDEVYLGMTWEATWADQISKRYSQNLTNSPFSSPTVQTFSLWYLIHNSMRWLQINQLQVMLQVLVIFFLSVSQIFFSRFVVLPDNHFANLTSVLLNLSAFTLFSYNPHLW